jgi:hypothetical protein
MREHEGDWRDEGERPIPPIEGLRPFLTVVGGEASISMV